MAMLDKSGQVAHKQVHKDGGALLRQFINTNRAILILMFSLFVIACSESNDQDREKLDNKQSSASLTEEVNENTQSVPISKSTEQVQRAENTTPSSNDLDASNFLVLDISERTKNGKNLLAVTFSAPVDPSREFQSFFNVSEANSGIVDGAWVLSESGKIAWFNNTEPNTQYEVTVYKGMTSANGASMPNTHSETIKTRHLSPAINFDTDGLFLTSGLGGGLPVASVNVDQVNIDFFRVKQSKINQFLNTVNRNSSYYWGLERVTESAELVYSGRFDLDAPKNTRIKRNIDIQQIDELSQSGLYLAIMQEAGKYNKKSLVWFSVTDIGLHARRYQNQLDIYASSLKTGKPLSGIKVSILDKDSNLIKESKTTSEGLASFLGSLNKAKLIVAQNKNNYSMIEFRQPALDLSEFDLGRRPHRPLELFVYTPRDLFRPGELIDFNGILRDYNGHISESPTLKVMINRPNGSTAKTFRWAAAKKGYYHSNWKIPSDAELGSWEFIVSGPFKAPIIYPFKIEEFLPERMTLSFNQNLGPLVNMNTSDALSISVQGSYLYGAPASGNRLTTMVSISQWRKPIESLPNYVFGNVKEIHYNQKFDLEDIYLDEQGVGQLLIRSQWEGSRSPLKVKSMSSLYESGGRPITRSHASLVWPQSSLIGIRSDFGDSNPEQNSRVGFDIVKAQQDGRFLAAKNLEVKLVREDRQYFWVYSEHRGWYWDWSDKEYVESTASLTIEEGKKGRVEFPVSWGSYRLEVRDFNDNAMSSVRFYAGHNWYSDWERAQQGAQSAKPDKVTLALNKGKYGVGDFAKLKILPPDAGEALVLVEADSPLWSKRLSVSEEGATVDIPISKRWDQHNIYISVVHFQPGNKKASIVPKRSFGLIHLPLDRNQRKIEVAFDLPEKSLPEKTLQAKVKLSDKDGAPVENAYLTLSAVDVGVLNISSFETPDPFEAFFGQRRYNVDALDMYDDVVELNKAPHARLRFGGDTDLARGGSEAQADVQIVSLFSELVEVDRNGETIIPLDIPDFNGRIRLMALAFSEDSYGSADEEVTIAAPIVTQLAMPRFLANGDQSTLALDLRNLSDEHQDLNIDFNLSGPIKLASRENSLDKPSIISLAKGEKRVLTFPVEAIDYTSTAKIHLKVAGNKIEDFEREWQLGVRPAYPALISQVKKVLQVGESLSVDDSILPERLPGSAKAHISVSNSADLKVDSQLEHLLQYPYGCLEQTTSRAFPLVFATQENQGYFSIQSIDDNKRNKMIEVGLDRIASMQLANGAYGLWSNTSNEEHWLTAYVGDFLLNARDMGVDVPYELIDKTMSRLKKYVNHSGRFIGERWSRDPEHYTFAYKAYASYVLSRVNQAPLGSMRTLYDKRLENAKSGLAQVQLGIALKNMGDHKRGNNSIEKGINNLPEERQYWGDYGSDVRDTGMIIYLLMNNHLYENEARKMSLDLVSSIQQREWFSTQERIAMFLAGIALKSNRAEPWQAELLIGKSAMDGGASESIEQSDRFSRVLGDEDLSAGISIISKYNETLFVDVDVSAYGKNAPKKSSNGLHIARRWYDKNGKRVEPEKVKVGELYVVHLEVGADKRVPDALVIDLLPAGFELENQNLDHAIKLDEFRVEGKTIQELQKNVDLKHQEFRDDRYVAAVDVSQYQSSHLFYLIRAVTPGYYAVPNPLVEDMYRPEVRGVGDTLENITVESIH